MARVTKTEDEKRGRVAARPLPSEVLQPIRKLPKDHAQAALGLADRSRLSSAYYRDKQMWAPWDRCHPVILDFAKRFRKEWEKRHLPLYPFEFHRSNARQRELLALGRSKAGPGQSPHNWGLAVDVIHLDRLWDLTAKEWAMIGALGKEVARKMGLKLVWGGDWNFYDPAHWELENWREWRSAHERLSEAGTLFPANDEAYFRLLDQEVFAMRERIKRAAAGLKATMDEGA